MSEEKQTAVFGGAFGAAAAAQRAEQNNEAPNNPEETVEEDAFNKTAASTPATPAPAVGTKAVVVSEGPKDDNGLAEAQTVIYVANRPMLTVNPVVGTRNAIGRGDLVVHERVTKRIEFVSGVFQTSDPDLIAALDKQTGMHYRRATVDEARQMQRLTTAEFKTKHNTSSGTAVSTSPQDLLATTQKSNANLSDQNKLFAHGLEGPVPGAAQIEGL